MDNLMTQSEQVRSLGDAKAVLDECLEDALSMLRADRGNIQVVDPASGSLRIVAQAGFSDEFLEYFAVVNDDGSACGRAARQLEQTVIADVNTDPSFAPHREIAAASRFRAVQSTPLVDLHGHLVGVLSTHYPRPYRPSSSDLGLMKRFGELVGQAVEASLGADGQATSLQFAEPLARRATNASLDGDTQPHTAPSRRVSVACHLE